MALGSGSSLGHYLVGPRIGAGGMGEVYRARDTKLDREVALKVIAVGAGAGTPRMARFKREARALASLSHPHICTVHDIGHEDGVDFIVMELLQGEVLADRLKKDALPLNQVYRFGVEIAEALHEAHRAGIVHRDLKPGNVMLTRHGAKLMDFGVARIAPTASTSVRDDAPTETAEETPLTRAGTLIGTPAIHAGGCQTGKSRCWQEG